VGEDYVYVANRDSKSISKINRYTNIVDATIPLDKYPLAVAIGADGYIYAIVSLNTIYYTPSNMAYLYRIDPDTNSKTTQMTLHTISNITMGIGVSSDNIAYIPFHYSWGVYTSVMIIDLNTWTKKSNFSQAPVSYGYIGPGVVIDDTGNGWFSSMRAPGQQRIMKITPQGQITSYGPLGNQGELVIDDEGYLWARSYPHNLIKMNTANGSYTGYSCDGCSNGGGYKAGLTFANGYIWFVDPGSDSVRKIDPVTGEQVTMITVGDRPISLGDLSGYEAYRAGVIADTPQCSLLLSGTDRTMNPLPLAGQSIIISGSIETTTTLPLFWQVNIDGRIVAEGSGGSVEAAWDGRNNGGKIAPGIYEVKLSASTSAGQCGEVKTIQATVDWDDDCRLEVKFAAGP